MKITIVSQYFWPENFQINEIVKRLSKKGISIDILTAKPNYPQGNFFDGYRAWGCQREEWNGLTIYRLPILARGRSGWRLALNYFSFVISGILCAPWLLRKSQPDMIFVYAPSPILQAIPAIILGWFKRCPVALWIQDLWPESLLATGYVQHRIALRLVEHVVRVIYKCCDLLLVPSRAFEAPVRTLAGKTPIVYYPNSIDEVFWQPVPVKIPTLEGLGSGFTVMFAGNIGMAQAVDVVLGAASLLKSHTDIHFMILGDGSCREGMVEAAKKQGLTNFHLPGPFPIEMMPGFMRQADALLVTLADWPIFAATVPNKIQAYFAVGRPIIACLNGEGARLVMDAGAGFASPAGDAQGLVDVILKLYDLAPGERKTMGANGRRYYEEHFNPDHLTDQLVGHLEQLVHQRKEKE